MSLNATNLYLQASPLPTTFKGSPNDFFAEMIKRMRILSPSGTNFIFIGDTEPTSNVGPWLKNGTQWYVWDEVTKRYIPQNISASFTPSFFLGNSRPSSTNPTLWLQTTLDATNLAPLAYGNAIRWLFWNGTEWVWPHDVPPGSGIRQMWVGTEADLWFFDGGDGTDPAVATDTTGGMWMVDTVFNSKSPRGAVVGTLDPGVSAGADVATVPLPSYLPPHFHNESLRVRSSQTNWHNWGNGVVADPGNLTHFLDAGPSNDCQTVTTASAGGGAIPDVVVPTIPASVGTFFIKRSARKYYTP